MSGNTSSRRNNSLKPINTLFSYPIRKVNRKGEKKTYIKHEGWSGNGFVSCSKFISDTNNVCICKLDDITFHLRDDDSPCLTCFFSNSRNIELFERAKTSLKYASSELGIALANFKTNVISKHGEFKRRKDVGIDVDSIKKFYRWVNAYIERYNDENTSKDLKAVIALDWMKIETNNFTRIGDSVNSGYPKMEDLHNGMMFLGSGWKQIYSIRQMRRFLED